MFQNKAPQPPEGGEQDLNARNNLPLQGAGGPKQVYFQDWGVLDYQLAWDLQEKVFAEIVLSKTNNRIQGTNNPTKNYLVFVEHPNVYTLGKSGKPENLLLNEQGLKDKNATYYRINRGGDITYH